MRVFPILLFCATLLSCDKGRETDPPNNEKALIMLMNHTGHNSPNRYCGNELDVIFFLSSPRENLEVRMDPDFRRMVGLDIKIGEFISVSVIDARTKQALAETSGHFSGGRINGNGEELMPAIRLCPKDHLEFTYF